MGQIIRLITSGPIEAEPTDLYDANGFRMVVLERDDNEGGVADLLLMVYWCPIRKKLPACTVCGSVHHGRVPQYGSLRYCQRCFRKMTEGHWDDPDDESESPVVGVDWAYPGAEAGGTWSGPPS